MSKILITSPQGKEKLTEAFKALGAEVVTELSTDVKLIIPTVDEELPFFASAKGYFEANGIKVMVSDPLTIRICRDKRLFDQFCRDNAIPVPERFASVVVKPPFGKASKGVQIFHDPEYIIQEKCEGEEYSADYFADFDGVPLAIIPRKRMNVVGGESKSGVVDTNELFISRCFKLGTALRIKGHAVIQFFYDGHDIKFTEVNPRYGGGSWMTFERFNSPKWLLGHL